MPFTFQDVVTVFAGIVTIATALALFRGWHKNAPVALDGWAERRLKGRRSDAVMDELLAQFRPNGGLTMRDSLNRLEAGQKTIEDTLMEMQAGNHANFLLDPSPLWMADAAGVVTHVNHAFCDLVGRDDDEVTGHNWKNLVHSEDVDRVVRAWNATVKDHRDFNGHWRMHRRDGKTIHLDYRGECVKTPAGKVLGWRGRVTLHEDSKALERPHAPSKTRLLFVDDSRDTTEVMRMGLGMNPNFHIAVANSGGDAIQQTDAAHRLGHTPDVVVLDYSMPDMDGVETARMLRQIAGRRFKLFFLTGNADQISEAERNELDIDAVWTKPISVEEIERRILEAP